MFCLIHLTSLTSELSGTTVGLPFGPYHYTAGLGPKWFDHVPLLIPLSWFMMAVPSYAIARRLFAVSGARAAQPHTQAKFHLAAEHSNPMNHRLHRPH